MDGFDKFYATTLVTDAGCMEWQGAITASTGYGKARHDGRPMDTHRISWMLTRGPIPNGMDVCHTCDNRACVNPLHLFLGTRRDNMIDARAKGRTSVAAMVAAHPVKLTDEQVRAINSMASRGIDQRTIADRFGIARQTVSKIVLRQKPRYAALLESMETV